MAMRYASFWLSILVLIAITQAGCNKRNHEQTTPATWRSDHHDVSFQYPRDWTLLQPFLDSEKAVTAGAIDNTTGMSLVIKLTEDVPKTMVSDETYFEAVRNQMLTHASGNTLLDESETEFVGSRYHRMHFTMTNPKFDGDFRQVAYIRRTGEFCIACQLNYPVSTDNQIPPQLQSLIDGLELP
ncbi:hypothetical protein [Novipirellula aureliae]|uniref:hypothetical protein n=1 Tax=Novipirellula aureliae TaxID=2527966 RepID=UPI0011B48EBA|nr:hypothetical protein [Novipirellula aureliae]